MNASQRVLLKVCFLDVRLAIAAVKGMAFSLAVEEFEVLPELRTAFSVTFL